MLILWFKHSHIYQFKCYHEREPVWSLPHCWCPFSLLFLPITRVDSQIPILLSYSVSYSSLLSVLILMPQFYTKGDPSSYFMCPRDMPTSGFEYVLTFCHKKIFQARLLPFLLLPSKSVILLNGEGNLEIKIWILLVLTSTRVWLLLDLLKQI